jgi:hypothetical protein
MVFFQKGNQ